jgi:hypothetical protein
MSNGSLVDRTVVIPGGSRGIWLTIVGSSRSPKITADAAVEIISRPSREATGNCCIDADVLH